MTVIVSVRCNDGIVIGADSVATSSAGPMRVMQVESDEKIAIFGTVMLACSGSMGYAQRLHDHVQMAIKGGVFKQQNYRAVITNISSRFIKDLQSSQAMTSPQNGIGFGAAMAFVHADEAHLVEYGTNDFQPETKKDKNFFASIGSGQLIADPFLAFVNRVLWKGAIPSLELGRLGVYWTLDQALKHAPGGVGGDIRLAVLQKLQGVWTASALPDTEEPAQFISALEGSILSQAHSIIANAKATTPPTPPAI